MSLCKYQYKNTGTKATNREKRKIDQSKTAATVNARKGEMFPKTTLVERNKLKRKRGKEKE